MPEALAVQETSYGEERIDHIRLVNTPEVPYQGWEPSLSLATRIRKAQEAVPQTTSLDPLTRLINDAERHPLLQAEEEVELAMAVERGHIKAKDLFINCNILLVVSIANKSQQAGLPLIDLVMEGTIGLTRAVEKFDYRKGFKFSTYADQWIRQAIQQYLEKRHKHIRLPQQAAPHLSIIGNFSREFVKRNGREPTNEEIAAETSLNIDQIEYATTGPQVVTSLYKPLDEEGERTLADIIGNPDEAVPYAIRYLTPEAKAAKKEQATQLAMLLSHLTETETRVIEMSFGFGKYCAISSSVAMAEIIAEEGEVEQLTPHQVRQTKERALAKLAAHPDSQAFKAYLCS